MTLQDDLLDSFEDSGAELGDGNIVAAQSSLIAQLAMHTLSCASSNNNYAKLHENIVLSLIQLFEFQLMPSYQVSHNGGCLVCLRFNR